MTAPISLLPPQNGAGLPAPQIQGLTDDQQRLVTGLSLRLSTQNVDIMQRFAYYDGLQRLQNLGISIPQVLSGVRTVVDWPRICVDPLVMRARFAGFRLPKSTEVHAELGAIWDANDMAAEFPLALLDSLVAGRGWMIAGSSPDGAEPILTAESPLNMTGAWDPRTRALTAAYQAYEVEGVFRAVLYLPDDTISMARTDNDPWQIDSWDHHGLGEVPVVRMPNRARSSDREGRSEITPAIMNTTDSACRSLLGMEIAREVYSIPRMYVLGASEANFVGADGARKTALDMAMTKIMALERDEDGQLPQVGQFTAFDPSVFTKIIDEHAKLMASYTGFPPSYFGQTTTANPSSADAIRVAENGIDRHGQRVQTQCTAPVRKLGQLAWRIANGGRPLTDELKRLSVDWEDAATPTPAATTDAITKQVSVGAVPATSDVTLARLGYSPLERERLAQDRANDPAVQLEGELVNSLAARQARAGNAIANDLEAAATPLVAPETPAP